ncbi:albusnodin family lasso peptide [Streptomyces sp. NPDC001339]
MTDQESTTAQPEVNPFTPPRVIDLGNAAALTQGSDQNSTESKQSPYD